MATPPGLTTLVTQLRLICWDWNRADHIEAHPVGWGMIAVAVWPLGESARLILGHEHEDKELPLSLDLYVCPPRSQVR
jgi:hypothetical protein